MYIPYIYTIYTHKEWQNDTLSNCPIVGQNPPPTGETRCNPTLLLRRVMMYCFKNKEKHMGVSKNRGPQNGWFIMENPIKMGWFGGTNIFGNIHIMCWLAWTKPALLSSCLCRTSLKQSSLYLPLALDLSRPTSKKSNPTSASLQLSTKKSRYHQSVNELESPHPKRKPSSKKENNNPPNFLIHKISSMVFRQFFPSSGRLRSSSLQRLYTRCCGCRLRKNRCTSAMGFRNWACHERQRKTLANVPGSPGFFWGILVIGI